MSRGGDTHTHTHTHTHTTAKSTGTRTGGWRAVSRDGGGRGGVVVERSEEAKGQDVGGMSVSYIAEMRLRGVVVLAGDAAV